MASSSSPLPVEINVAPHYFRAIKEGRKSVEGRLDRGKFATLRKGSTLIIRPSMEKGVAAYRQFYAVEEESMHGVVALHLHVWR
jgi:ASC-1-like (ASCH) protein